MRFLLIPKNIPLVLTNIRQYYFSTPEMVGNLKMTIEIYMEQSPIRY